MPLTCTPTLPGSGRDTEYANKLLRRYSPPCAPKNDVLFFATERTC
jgi:hypothetical protein